MRGDSRDGRRASTALEYIASYADLIRAFGVNDHAGASHYIQAGRFEGRAASFDGLEYIASYGDLISAFRYQIAANPSHDIGSSHYIATGYTEGRHVTFDALEYIASYGDLIKTFGANGDAGASHYIVAGSRRGAARHVRRLGVHRVLRRPDQRVPHPSGGESADPDIGAIHYIAAGYASIAPRTNFNAAQYLANYADLQAVFGTDTEAATMHYITNGYFEGRTDHPLASSCIAGTMMNTWNTEARQAVRSE